MTRSGMRSEMHPVPLAACLPVRYSTQSSTLCRGRTAGSVTMPEAKLVSFAALPIDRPMPLIERKRIIGEKMMISEVHLSKGFSLATHQHDNEQHVVMLSGRCTFGIGNKGQPGYKELDVRGGQVLV